MTVMELAQRVYNARYRLSKAAVDPERAVPGVVWRVSVNPDDYAGLLLEAAPIYAALPLLPMGPGQPARIYGMELVSDRALSVGEVVLRCEVPA